MSDLGKIVKYSADNKVCYQFSGRLRQSTKLRKASVNKVELLGMAELKAWMVAKCKTTKDQCFFPH